MSARPAVHAFFDELTGTVTHLIADPATGMAAVVDPVLDFDFKSGAVATRNADRVLAHLREHGLQLQWILETHVHADHLSAAHYLQQQAGGRIAIGEHIGQVQAAFRTLYNLGPDFAADGSQFDHLLGDGEGFLIGTLQATAWLVPGHTPADMAYLVGDDVFVGDTLFMPDVGSARADFPGGDARTLHRSIRRLLDLPPHTRLHTCHDYPPDGRAPRWEATVAEHRAHNIHAHDGIDEDAYVRLRTARDATLAVPMLILPSLQVNLRAGSLPVPEDNGVAYLRIPLNALKRRP